MQQRTRETPSREGRRTKPDWVEIVRGLGPRFAERAREHDEKDTFVAENYDDLKDAKAFAAGVPEELGGGGASHAELCAMVRELGRHDGATALAFSMHTHLVAASVWRWRHGQPAEALLRRVAEEQIVLVSTGAHDWLESNGTVVREDGGFRVSAAKPFSSGSPAGDLLITSAPYDDPESGRQVLHFAVPLSAEGVRRLDDWRTMGMRATGSDTVLLEDVFVPESAVTMRRPAAGFHPLFVVVSTVALPIVMSAYLGVAEAARERALERAAKRKDDASVPYLIGEMEGALESARLALDAAIADANDYDFEPGIERANRALVRKTLMARGVHAAVEKAMEVVGGASFYRPFGLERLVRDVHGAQFHPLPEKRQHRFTGRLMLGLDPVG